MAVQEEIDDLKHYMMELAYQTSKTDMNVLQLSKEMKDFKNEMKDFKNEMKEFKNEMKEYKNQSGKEIKEMNKQWGNLANKMGTVVEDIVVPAIRPLVEKYFEEKVTDLMIRRKKNEKKIHLKGEYDAIALKDNNIYLFEVKSTPTKEYLKDFLKNIEKFRLLFPEYADRKLIPIFGGLWVEPGIIKTCSKEGIFIMSYREWDFMDILNFKDVKRKEF